MALRFPAMPGELGSVSTSEMQASVFLVLKAQGLRIEWPAAKPALGIRIYIAGQFCLRMPYTVYV